jgi:hypothetical protein
MVKMAAAAAASVASGHYDSDDDDVLRQKTASWATQSFPPTVVSETIANALSDRKIPSRSSPAFSFPCLQ